jgi:hypothetical protein
LISNDMDDIGDVRSDEWNGVGHQRTTKPATKDCAVGSRDKRVKTSHAACMHDLCLSHSMIINVDITSHSLTFVSHRVLGSENTSEAPDRYKLATHVRHGDQLSQHLFGFAGWC